MSSSECKLQRFAEGTEGTEGAEGAEGAEVAKGAEGAEGAKGAAGLLALCSKKSSHRLLSARLRGGSHCEDLVLQTGQMRLSSLHHL